MILSDSVEIKSKDKFVSENYRLLPSSIKLFVQLVDLEQELPHTRICDGCQSDILNRFFHCSECIPSEEPSINESALTSKFKPRFDGIDLCFECFLRGRCCRHSIMTLMQTFEANDGPNLIIKRATNCIKNWATRISKVGLLESLPSTAQNLETINSFIFNLECKSASSPSPLKDSDKSPKILSLGTLAFDGLINMANNILFNSNGGICFACHKNCRSYSECLIKCRSCTNKICHQCLWNILAVDPFEASKGNLFQCSGCFPKAFSSLELASKKADTILQWIGCVSFGASYSNSTGHSLPTNSKLVPCFFDNVVAAATKKISTISKSNTNISYKGILVAFFEKCSDTKSLRLQKSEKRKKSEIKTDDFEACLSKNLDLGLGLAIKNRTRNKKQTGPFKSYSKSLMFDSVGQTNTLKKPSNNREDSFISISENSAAGPRSSIPDIQYLQCTKSKRKPN